MPAMLRLRPAVRLAACLAALALVALPGQALPIEEPPMRETLVEGHTVLLTIEAYQRGTGENFPPVIDPLPAAAGAEGAPLPVGEVATFVERFPGVLWPNDEHLVPSRLTSEEGIGTGVSVASTYGAAMMVLVRADDDDGIREPCGGAILAVNAGDPDPRLLLLTIDGADPVAGEDHAPAALALDTTSMTASSDGGHPLDYVESYLLTDPNDHHWIVDKYAATTHVSLPDGATTTRIYPVWVVNVLGGPAFVPDLGQPRLDRNTCAPLRETGNEALQLADGVLCGVGTSFSWLPGLPTPEGLLPGDVASLLKVTTNPYNGQPAWNDDPCMTYMEPSRNGHCYGGQVANAVGCVHVKGWPGAPFRRYHALLYFPWEDLTIGGAPRDHCGYGPIRDWEGNIERYGCNPGSLLDTNACQSATEWTCPGEEPWERIPGADDLEGNSHAFHPYTPPHVEAGTCGDAAGANPTNHGGSTDPTGVCDYAHATAQVDVYFSGAWRPSPPAARLFTLVDLEGSYSPFADFHTAYPGVG